MIIPNRFRTGLAVAALAATAAATLARPQQAPPLSSAPPLPSATPGAFRPPSVPLIAHDPYFSVWSPSDTLNGSQTQHWTGKAQPLCALVRVDGKPFRLMGREPSSVPPLPQTGVEVTPTRTIYKFANREVAASLTFMTPALPGDIEAVSRPVTYITIAARSLNGTPRKIETYFDAGGELAVNTPDQKVIGDRPRVAGMTALRIGSEEQPVLAKRGDDLRIDWGHLYVAAPQNRDTKSALALRETAENDWARTGALYSAREIGNETPRAADGGGAPVVAFSFDMGRVGAAGASRTLLVGYDDGYSLTYMGRKLRPYWRRSGQNMAGLLPVALRDFPRLQRDCIAFDAALTADAVQIGGPKYARIVALAHRQALAANKIVADANGAPLMFSKENFSNGCIATVDILYPAAPQLLLLSPTLAKASLRAVLNYAASPRWKFPFAPHDLGTYPRADGQVYGGGERTEENQMPVEETGNMLILLAAVARRDGDAKFCEPFWPLISRWARYLEEKGFDPENQLCTDDFAGHLAHNVNLSAKAIEALGAYAALSEMRPGVKDKMEGRRARAVAKAMALRWAEEGRDGDHFRLAFDRPGTWSQKYNLAWDRTLGLNLFPPSVLTDEIRFYRKNLNRYGLPLDNREPYTKLDWTIWTASLTSSRADFDALIAPTYDFLNATTDRVPMTDWHQTREPRQVGFQARAVVGGVFLPFLTRDAVWKKWASRDKTARKAWNWDALPTPPQVTTVVQSSQNAPRLWTYTLVAPSPDWSSVVFDGAAADTWKIGPGGFGTIGTPDAIIGTEWNTSDIWARRSFNLPASADVKNLQLWIHHDENAEVYINGVLAAHLSGYTSGYEATPISAAARATLKLGNANTLAVHCHQTRGGQYIDVGLVVVKP